MVVLLTINRQSKIQSLNITRILLPKQFLGSPKLDGLEFKILHMRIGSRDCFKRKLFRHCLAWMVTKHRYMMASLLLFFRSCWAIVKDDLMHIFHNFHEHEMFEKSLNATFIAVIPKKTE
jgi:hypothetical protein